LSFMLRKVTDACRLAALASAHAEPTTLSGHR